MEGIYTKSQSRCWSLEGSDPATWQPGGDPNYAPHDAAKVLVVIEAVPMAGFCLLNGTKISPDLLHIGASQKGGCLLRRALHVRELDVQPE